MCDCVSRPNPFHKTTKAERFFQDATELRRYTSLYRSKMIKSMKSRKILTLQFFAQKQHDQEHEHIPIRTARKNRTDENEAINFFWRFPVLFNITYQAINSDSNFPIIDPRKLS